MISLGTARIKQRKCFNVTGYSDPVRKIKRTVIVKVLISKGTIPPLPRPCYNESIKRNDNFRNAFATFFVCTPNRCLQIK